MPRQVFMVVAVVVLGAAVAARQPPQGAPTFQSGVELVQIDVSVLDRSRQPVVGLTADDFTVDVDGKRRPVVAFKAVTVPPPPPLPSARWMRDVAPDVATNIHPSGRVVAILIDDYSFGDIGPGAIQRAKRVVNAAIDALGAEDRAAVLFTGNSHTAQGFTSDRRLLTRAIDRAGIFAESQAEVFANSSTGADGGRTSGGEDNGFCYCGVCSIEALVNVTRSLRSLPDQRKVVLYVSAGSVVLVPHVPETECNARKRSALHDAIRGAHLANVTIESVDPKGLVTGGVTMRPVNTPTALRQATLDNPTTQRVEFLRTVSESTGGRAVVNNNDGDRQVSALLSESGSYYLLGVEPAPVADDGRLHPIRVRVNRRDVEIRARSGYYDPTPRERDAIRAMNEGRDLTMAVADPMPKASFPVEVVATPVANQHGEPAVALVVGVREPVDAATRATGRVDLVDVTARLFNPETGKGVESRLERIAVEWKPTDAAFGQYEVLTGLPAVPGRYELRVGVLGGEGRVASAYTYVDVPDFRAGFAVSGLMLHAEPAIAFAVGDDLAGLVPISPTTRRTFTASDRVTAFLRIHQGPNAPAAAVKMAVTDSTNQILKTSDTVVARSEVAGIADYQADLPLADLRPGEYLLTIDVASGAQKEQRALRFRIVQP